jgi:uncharacterized protein YacL (UPF0231 family)
MDYKFVRDVTGTPFAECDAEASVFGDWLNNEIGSKPEAVAAVLQVIEQLQSGQLNAHKLKGRDYTLILDADEAELHSHLGYWDEDAELPEGTELDQQTATGCGLQDLKELLLDWHEFIVAL